MEIMLELFLTAFVALVFSFLIAKFVSFAMAADSVSGVEDKPSIHAADSVSGVEDKPSIHAADSDDNTIMEHLDLSHKFQVQSFKSENKVDFVKESGDDDDDSNKVDVFEPVYDDDQGFECENKVERSKVEAFESEKEVEFMQETAQVELKAKLDDFVFENKIEEIEAQNEIKVQSEERQMKGLVEEEKEMKLGSYDDDDNEWERIEKSELENVYGAAAKFSEQKGDLGIGNDVEMELHGLHKIATEGSCCESQPLTSMLSSSSKWNAWQRPGNVNPEGAMEQHVTLLSDNIPGLMEDNSDGEQRLEFAEGGVPGSVAPDKQAVFMHERNADLKFAPGGGDITESASFEKQVKDD